jgi:hypothetical protein
MAQRFHLRSHQWLWLHPCGFLLPVEPSACVGIELSATDQVGQILLTLIVQTMKKKILAIEAEGLGGNAKSDNLEVGELGDNTTSWDVSVSVNTISS